MRLEAIYALASQSPLPPEILQGVLDRLSYSDWQAASRVEALLSKQDDFLSILLHSHSHAAASALCRIWTEKSFHERFACYVRDGTVYF
ncbi:hypothetical protein BDV18DRAFT_142258, partial [Aspergillus unguis]